MQLILNDLENLPIKLRPALDNDKAFIKKSWVNSFGVSDFAKPIQKQIYRSHHSTIVEHLLQKSQTMILCNKEEEEEILSFVTYRKLPQMFIIDYIYTKAPYRKMKFASYLLAKITNQLDDDTIVFHTHETNPWKSFKNALKSEYDPYLLHIRL